MPAVELLQELDGSAWDSENETNGSVTVPPFHFSKWNKAQVTHKQLKLWKLLLTKKTFCTF